MTDDDPHVRELASVLSVALLWYLTALFAVITLSALLMQAKLSWVWFGVPLYLAAGALLEMGVCRRLMAAHESRWAAALASFGLVLIWPVGFLVLMIRRGLLHHV